ncbi:stimulus-sensing domain-containing protein [Paralimibaculum aggregatum]|uniref:stimulus-sensing domain-containing protein n=1 Tax=Paralimibaculum aggregatum TaxID=3036245 RepID=UPI00255273A7|nr:stimulus-sensing domain-containing protein [Limibaculum sp. NKW23]
MKQSAPFSSLQRRIIFFNLAGLAFLVLGVLYLNQFRSGLIEQRVDALETQAELIALTIGETAGYGNGRTDYDQVRANLVLARLARPTGLRARLYDSRMRLTGDTRNLGTGPEAVETAPLPPAGAPASPSARASSALERTYEQMTDILRPAPPRYDEAGQGGISRDFEVQSAVRGASRSAVRVNDQDQLIVSVAVPVRRMDAILGALVLSTPGGDIDAIVRGERVAIFQVFLVAAIVSTALSILLANTIARPIKRLARAADTEGTSAARPLNPERVEIPDMSHRTDEIGELSAALIRMTEALYKRIQAIESFASDVAHEIKNPLTSLRSAVDTMKYAKTPEQRQRLLDVIAHDVGRMDRLVTDISNASRLDAELVRERMENFDLGRLISMLAEVTRSQGEKRGVSVAAELPGGALTARGLEGRIAQVITNLLDNALSFSPEGGTIRIVARQRPGGIRVAVEDQGPGVPPDNITSIFERFYTERPEAEAFGNHSGLGLSISRQIIEAHAGRIWVENIRDPEAGPEAPVKGARFVFDLPA